MDEKHFWHTSNEWYIKLLRQITVPMRRTFFLRTGEGPSAMNRFFSRLFYRQDY